MNAHSLAHPSSFKDEDLASTLNSAHGLLVMFDTVRNPFIDDTPVTQRWRLIRRLRGLLFKRYVRFSRSLSFSSRFAHQVRPYVDSRSNLTILTL